MIDPSFFSRLLPWSVRLKCFFYQKILRVNWHVPWPCHPTSVIKSPQKIKRGTRFPGLSPWVYLDGRNGIIFGYNVWIGPGVKIISMNHDTCCYDQYIEAPPVIIGNNCWLAANATVLASVELADHIVVAAGSVVTKSFLEPNQLIAGVPARRIKDLPAYQMKEPKC